mgnify:CR=1 FL=1
MHLFVVIHKSHHILAIFFFFFFVEFFLNLLETGQRELDVMFSTAYGLQYKQNQDVFNQLFANFQRYYKGGDISLNDAMNTVSIRHGKPVLSGSPIFFMEVSRCCFPKWYF